MTSYEFANVDPVRSRNMRAIRSKNMKPEMVVRRLVHGLGYRYRLHRKDLPGKPDLVFPGRKKVIFVHGCFWHQHSDASCPIARIPKTNKDYWVPKLERNLERDKLNIRKLEEQGWSTLTIWECQTKNFESAQDKIQQFLENT